jgi:RNA polymerase sigma factor (sigma-70 family)
MTTGQTNRVFIHLHRLALLQERGDLTDAQLLERFLARREEIAFEELVRRHGPMVLGVCRRVLGRSHDAEDAFQATFLVLVRRAVSIVPRSRVGPWLYGVARRTALKARASAARRRRAEQQAARDRPLTTPPADMGGDLRPLLDEELGRLPEKYRDSLVLCLLEGKSRKEAAGQLGWSEGTLSGRLARAKELLGERLRRRGVSLAGVTLLATLEESAAAAGVPASLAAATVKAVTSLIGQAAAPAVCIPVVALSEEVMKSMLASKLKAVAGVLVLVAGIGSAATWQYGPAARGTAPADTAADVKGVAAPEKKSESKRVPGGYDVGGEPPGVASPAKKPHGYIIEPPDILHVRYAPPDGTDPVRIAGERLVRPDGTISLGLLGSVSVSGRTPEGAHAAIAKHLARRLDSFDPKKLTVEVANRSKFFYVIADGPDGGEQVYRFPATGRESVLDAIAGAKTTLIGLGRKYVYVLRLSDDGKSSRSLPVDCVGLTQRGNPATNYVLQPGDRVYIQAPPPKKAASARRTDAVKAAETDPLRELETILKALHEARSQEEQRRIVEELEGLTKKLREQLNKPRDASDQ